MPTGCAQQEAHAEGGPCPGRLASSMVPSIARPVPGNRDPRARCAETSVVDASAWVNFWKRRLRRAGDADAGVGDNTAQPEAALVVAPPLLFTDTLPRSVKLDAFPTMLSSTWAHPQKTGHPWPTGHLPPGPARLPPNLASADGANNSTRPPTRTTGSKRSSLGQIGRLPSSKCRARRQIESSASADRLIVSVNSRWWRRVGVEAAAGSCP